MWLIYIELFPWLRGKLHLFLILRNSALAPLPNSLQLTDINSVMCLPIVLRKTGGGEKRERERKSLRTQTSHEPPPCQKKWGVLLSAVFHLHVRVLLKVVIRLSQRGACKGKKIIGHARARVQVLRGHTQHYKQATGNVLYIITSPIKKKKNNKKKQQK